MKNKKTGLLAFALVGLMLAGHCSAAVAAPHFTLTPATNSVSVGSTFFVDLGADSETEQIIAMDLVGTFDPTKLEIVSIEKNNTTAYNFVFDSTTPIIQNSSGKFESNLSQVGQSVYEGQVVKGSLLRIKLKAKGAGVASLNLSCQAGSVTDSNMFNQNSEDVVSCAANQSGSYTISAVGGDSGSTTEAETTVTTTSAGEELPQTGGIANTIGLVVFGAISVLGAVLLRFL
ncbi:MAG: cohesin domain-containing protein [Patescibacteria group bacterium]|jgi:LPXTG-motif cell wall-anchored protein